MRSAWPTSTRSCRRPSGPRYIGVYGGNGSTTASYDYLRFTPDSAVDAAPPVSSHGAPAPDGAGGWYRSPVDVTLSAADDGECVSGVERTEYRVGGGAFATYTAPVRVAADGEHTLEYRSLDKAGNVETAKSAAVKLDATAPSTAARRSGGSGHPARSRLP